MAISINKKTIQEQEQIIKAYENNMSLREIERQYGVSRQTVSAFLEKKGIKKTKGNHYRKFFHNEDFFEVIDNEEKAYWLGFMYADGWVMDHSQRYGQDQFGISLKIDDEQHIRKFLTSIKATNPITYDYSSGRKHALAKVVLTSQKTVNDLIKHGCFKKKTFLLQPPTTIPDDLIPHFIRGFFDGDGSIVKASGKYYEKYHKYHFQVSFSCMETIAYWLQHFFGFGSVVKDQRSKQSFSYTLGGRNCILKFYHTLYDNATIYLDRKYERFQEFLIQ